MASQRMLVRRQRSAAASLAICSRKRSWRQQQSKPGGSVSEDLIVQSLEIAAENGDITEQIYQRYYEISPESAELMRYVDDNVKGKMMDEIYRLLMVQDYAEESAYLNWEVDNHEMAYSVLPRMYDGLFEAVYETVEACLGDNWTDACAAAWHERLGSLQQEVLDRFSKAS